MSTPFDEDCALCLIGLVPSGSILKNNHQLTVRFTCSGREAQSDGVMFSATRVPIKLLQDSILIVTKLKRELTSFTKMRVDLAAQVSSVCVFYREHAWIIYFGCNRY